MINTILMIFLMSNTASAGSICNDGTYSYSEGRGTCSHHGGVSSSGVYLRENSTYNTNTEQRSDIEKISEKWFNNYGVNKEGAAYHSVLYIKYPNAFGYSCFVYNGSIGEMVTFFVNIPGIKDHPDNAVAERESIKIFAHTVSGYKLISGHWEWNSEDNTLMIQKTNNVMQRLAEPLSKADMSNILLSDYFAISIKDRPDTIITPYGLKNQIIDTWNKCKASL